MLVGKLYDAAKNLRSAVSDTKESIKGAIETTIKLGSKVVKAGQAVFSSIKNKIEKEQARKETAAREAAKKEKKEKKNKEGVQR